MVLPCSASGPREATDGGRAGAGLHRPRRDGRADLRQSGAQVRLRVVGFDPRAAPLARLAADGLVPADAVEAVGQAATIVFLSLPGGDELAEVGARLLP